jgi:hypothetical protein
VKLILHPIFPLGTHLRGMWIDGKRKGQDRTVDKYQTCPTIRAVMKSHLEIRFEHSGGVSVVPPRPRYLRGELSTGLRIIRECWNQGAYEMTVEGMMGKEYLLDVFDPSGGVKLVDGGVALARDGGYLTLSVFFPKAITQGYVRTEVKLRGSLQGTREK